MLTLKWWFYMLPLLLAVSSQPALASSFFTSFEFSDSATFEIGENPVYATFAGGSARAPETEAYYHSGRYSWHVPGGGIAIVEFTIPAEQVAFWFRDSVAAFPSGYRVIDTDDTVIASGSGRPSFEGVQVVRMAGESRISRIEFESTGGGDTVVDDFSFIAFEQSDGS